MRSLSLLGVLLTVTAVFGQVQQARPAGPRPAGDGALQGEKKLRWICKQLRLDEEQMQQAEDLITIYNAETKDLQANAGELMQRIQDKFAELQAAKSANDPEKVKKLQEELRNLAPEKQTETHFFEGLQQVLTAQQKEKLPAIIKRAEAGGDTSLRPVHVLRAARKLGLSAEQVQKLETITGDFRTLQATSRPADSDAAEKRVDDLIGKVRAILTAEQATAYDKAIEELRESPPPPPAGSTEPPPAPPARPPTITPTTKPKSP